MTAMAAKTISPANTGPTIGAKPSARQMRSIPKAAFISRAAATRAMTPLLALPTLREAIAL